MGFSIRVAPGVRVRASSRGVRTSIGPRAARVHVGSGRTGFSTGAGPVTYYTSVGGSRRRTSSGSGQGSAAATRQLAAANRATEKAQEAEHLLAALRAILDVHRADFAAAQRPVAPEPPTIDTDAVRATHVTKAKATTSVFARAARKEAIRRAILAATAEVSATQATYRQQQQSWQAALDEQWDALNHNEPDTVLATLAEAFEDNEAAAAAVGVDGDQVSLVVVVPPVSAIPERQPSVTAAGNLSLKKLTKRETADFYKLLVTGHALVTVKEAFAVAPKIASARVVALRPTTPDAYGKVHPEVVLAGMFERNRLEGIQWTDADAVQVTNDASTSLILLQKGATKELAPVDLSKEPDLQTLVEAVDFEDLLD